VSYENNNERNNETFFSKRLKAGKIRTYFFDVRSTRSNDYFITLTESKKKYNEGGYERHKIFLYKEDFNKFLKALGETIDYVKTDLMPDFDFDAFNHEYPEGEEGSYIHSAETPVAEQSISTEKNEVAPDPVDDGNHADDTVDTW
jgi:hypothetical protein